MLPSTMTSRAPLATFSWLYYLKHIRKRLWLVGFIVLLGLGVGAIQVAKTRPLYRASARVLVEQSVMSESVTPFHDAYLASNFKSAFHQTQLKLLKSRSLAREVIATLQLEQHPDFAVANTSRSPGVMQHLQTWASPYAQAVQAYVMEKSGKFLALAPPILQTWMGWSTAAGTAPRPVPATDTPAPLAVQPTTRATVEPNTQDPNCINQCIPQTPEDSFR